MVVKKPGETWSRACLCVCYTRGGDSARSEEPAGLLGGCQELGQPSAESAVLACSPGFSTVENHWDTGSPLPNSSVCDVSGMIFALLPFSGMETEGSGEFALLSCPLALHPRTPTPVLAGAGRTLWGVMPRGKGQSPGCVRAPARLRLNSR